MQINTYPGFDIDKLREANPLLVIRSTSRDSITLSKPRYNSKLRTCEVCKTATASATLARRCWRKVAHKDQWVCPECDRG